MNTYCVVRSSRPARLFSFGLLDVLLRVRLRRPQLRGATAGFGLRRLATASMNNQGCRHRFLLRADAGVPFLNVTSASHARSNSATVQACAMRSEEHTSELQSRLHLVCRLLLEKKKISDTMLPSRSTTER